MDSKIKSGKHIHYTQEDIKKYINKVKKLVLDDNYTISKNYNRQENIDFIEGYKIDSKKEKKILLNLEFHDFCYAVNNVNKNYEHEILYVFCKNLELDNWGTLERLDIYIKINMVKTRWGDNFVIIVSFHKRNKPIKYLFK